jgi:hypothetical protein
MSNTILLMNRGDRFHFNMTVYDETRATGVYELKPDDVLYFALLNPHDRFEDAIILRGYTYDDAKIINTAKGPIHVFKIILEREDTINLEPGVYYYTIKLQKGVKQAQFGLNEEAANLTTVIGRTKFIINE